MFSDQHKTISVTSGKGGVGKSCIAYNLAMSLSLKGFKTLLIDTDFGLGVVPSLLGEIVTTSWRTFYCQSVNRLML